jgi:cytochrome c2
MRSTRPESATPEAARRSTAPSGPWTLAVVAAVAAAAGWFTGREPVRYEDAQRALPEPSRLPILPLTVAITASVLVGAGWLMTETWMAASQSDAVARALTGGDPARASAFVTRYGCGGCHTIPGLPAADGKVGPALSGLSERVFIAGVLPNTADNLIGWIVDPRAYSPRSAMPVTGISKAEARDIAAWLYAH